MKIPKPTRQPNEFGYQEECQAALAGALRSLHDQAVTAGWDDRAVNYALMVLAASNLKGREAATAFTPEEDA